MTLILLSLWKLPFPVPPCLIICSYSTGSPWADTPPNRAGTELALASQLWLWMLCAWHIGCLQHRATRHSLSPFLKHQPPPSPPPPQKKYPEISAFTFIFRLKCGAPKSSLQSNSTLNSDRKCEHVKKKIFFSENMIWLRSYSLHCFQG